MVCAGHWHGCHYSWLHSTEPEGTQRGLLRPCRHGGGHSHGHQAHEGASHSPINPFPSTPPPHIPPSHLPPTQPVAGSAKLLLIQSPSAWADCIILHLRCTQNVPSSCRRLTDQTGRCTKCVLLPQTWPAPTKCFCCFVWCGFSGDCSYCTELSCVTAECRVFLHW